MVWLQFVLLWRISRGDMNHPRIIASACGFTRDVHYAVREYNLTKGFHHPVGQSKQFIHLLHLNSIKGSLPGIIPPVEAVEILPTEDFIFCNDFLSSKEFIAKEENED